jgi:acetyl/propionyl-CoA carboxylase alpha subunit
VAVRKLLVAGRGEIAARIFRTCERLGISTVAVAAPDDGSAYHARRADEVVEIEGYLLPGEYLRAARRTGADAIHPGYGFLAENADFGAAVRDAGITWVGPPPAAMRLAAGKQQARAAAESLGLPVLESADAAKLGFPLIVKAAGGGGGRGMRVVRSEAELDGSLEAAAREAGAAFGDPTVFLEHYLERPRHLEVQVLGDRHGRVTALGERECSIQRRHQKLFEESPAARIDSGLRAQLVDAALKLAAAVRYESAGTVEFLVDQDDFFFLELNARIQVEHPVTELVTGLDLVELQIRIAEGVPLPDLAPPTGHAAEVRLCAEDPRTFVPQAGRIDGLRLPAAIRVDSGVEEGDEVPLAYDSLLAKLVGGGETRHEALDALSDGLRETEVVGIRTNLPFLRWLVDHPALRAGEVSTAFLVEHPPLSRAYEVPSVWRGYWRLNRAGGVPAPPPAAPPQIAAPLSLGRPAGDGSVVRAPTPATVARVLVSSGEHVEERQPLVVLESMKLETPLTAPYDAAVRHVHVAEGDRVAAGAPLVELAASALPSCDPPIG